MSPPQQWPRGPPNELHYAAKDGSSERTLALLSSGLIDIDQGTPDGRTPLMLAAHRDNSHVVRMLLNGGANFAIVGDSRCTALHYSAHFGHRAVTELLVHSGSDLEADNLHGLTPLHLAAKGGHTEAMSVLIKAGANPSSQTLTGITPLLLAATNGHADAVGVLLLAKADPLLRSVNPTSGSVILPLDAAVGRGESEVVRMMIQHLGIEGCGGATGGVSALQSAAMFQYVEIMRLLTDAGVDDMGAALINAAGRGLEESVKFFLRQRGSFASAGVCVNVPCVEVALLSAIRTVASRVVRLLVGAGAATTSTVRQTGGEGSAALDGASLALTNWMLREKKVKGEKASTDQLHRLEAIRRLLLRVEAVHAVSWLWPRNVLTFAPAASNRTGRSKTTSSPLASMLPVLRRRARRRDAVFAALFRWVAVHH